jgi:hypothetical protein
MGWLYGRMTHASVAGTDVAVADTLVRRFVGSKHVDDILADLVRPHAAMPASIRPAMVGSVTARRSLSR